MRQKSVAEKFRKISRKVTENKGKGRGKLAENFLKSSRKVAEK